MTEETTEAPKKLRGLADPEVRARAEATRAANKAAKEKLTAEFTQGENKVRPPESNRFSPATASAAVQARWATERGSEDEVRKHFAKTLAVDEGMQLLARMRKNCEIASYAINSRITAEQDTERCKTCGKKKPINKDWVLNRPHRDVGEGSGNTGLILVDHFCSMVCVALENQKTHGVKGLSDRGMTPDMNPENHPNTKE